METNQQTFMSDFLKQEAAGGILLMLAAIAALILANSPLAHFYALFIDTPVEVRIGKLEIAKPLILWINDGLMAIFFFLVGLELKRELIEGELADKKNIILPGLGAIGGMVVPAGIFLYFNHTDSDAISGWAIPAATDIAFALGILTLLGPRVPVSLKIFLTSLAIFDDIGAILIIAVFYTAQLSTMALIFVAACVPILFALNRRGVTTKSIYLTIGIVMWIAMLKSGVHATLAGVLLAMFIPIKVDPESGISPLKSLEHDLHSTVALIVLPIFAFANAGISFSGIGITQVLHPVPLGIAAGLFVGKQVGIFAFCWLGIKMGMTKLPSTMSWLSLYGASILCGVGFTMSLFIGSLAFEETGTIKLFDERLGIIIGSLASGIFGYFIIKMSLKDKVDAS